MGVAHHPDQVGDPDNIEFVTDHEHYIRHNNGRFRERTTGKRIDRSDRLKKAQNKRNIPNKRGGDGRKREGGY